MARAIALVKPATQPYEALQLLHLPKQSRASAGRVLIKITLRPINPSDLLNIRHHGLFQSPSQSPIIIGGEGFGLVEQIGDGVTKFQPGQRVIPLIWPAYRQNGQGSWQDYVELSEDEIIAAPDSITDEAAAQLVINSWSVYGLLDDLSIPKGEYVLQTAAASVLGRQLIQLARHWGIKTINIVRRDKWSDELKALGADEVINSETEDVVKRVKEITGGKLAYGAVDPVGGSLMKAVAGSVRNGGKVFLIGMLSGLEITLSSIDVIRGVQVSWWYLPSYVPTAEKKVQLCDKILKLVEEQVITPLAGKKYPLEDFLEAIEESEKEGRGGKVLLMS